MIAIFVDREDEDIMRADAFKMLHPRMYESVIKKLNDL